MSLFAGDDKRLTLFKYKAITANTLDMIENNHIYFSFPKDFNDPYDSYVNTIFKGTAAEFELWIDQLPATLPEKAMVRSLLQSNSYDGSVFVGKKQKNDTGMLIILCLAEEPDNIVLWNNYSQNHKGICLGFKTAIEGDSLGIYFDASDVSFRVPGITDGFLPTTKVKYTAKMPPAYNRILDTQDKLEEFLKTKHVKWNYEDERRIIYPYAQVRKQLISFKKESLDCVIFGMNIEEKNQVTITEIVYRQYINNGIDVKLFKTKMKSDDYRLELVQI